MNKTSKAQRQQRNCQFLTPENREKKIIESQKKLISVLFLKKQPSSAGDPSELPVFLGFKS